MISLFLQKYKECVFLSGALWHSFPNIKLDKTEIGSSEWSNDGHLVLSPALHLWFPLVSLSTAKGPKAVTRTYMGQ